MSEDASLLAAIRAAPEDDLPRLVYADWLDEQGQSERAEFIRVQCELERSEWADALRAERFADRPEYRGEWRRLFNLRRREGELFRTWRGVWFPPSSEIVVTVPTEVGRLTGEARFVVRRGFVAEWAGHVGGWCGIGQGPRTAVGPHVARVHPLQVVAFTDREPSPHPSRDRFGWWVEIASERDRHDLPRPLWARLRGGDGRVSAASTSVLWYSTRSQALADASAAAIAWALDQPDTDEPPVGVAG